MNELANIENYLPAMHIDSIDKVRELESFSADLPQIDIATFHIIHGGMYARTIMIPAGIVMTGALIKLATLLIIHGDVIVYIGGKAIELSGYNVLPASANRKQAFITKTDTNMTMIFPSSSHTVQDAEEEFTEELGLLLSRKFPQSNKIIITGE
jgi:hypothetical protein